MPNAFLDDLRLLRRTEAIFERYCAEGHRPTREEAADWLRSLGWREEPLANLLRQWGYEERGSKA